MHLLRSNQRPIKRLFNNGQIKHDNMQHHHDLPNFDDRSLFAPLAAPDRNNKRDIQLLHALFDVHVLRPDRSAILRKSEIFGDN